MLSKLATRKKTCLMVWPRAASSLMVWPRAECLFLKESFDELVSSCTLLEFEIHRSWVVQVLDPVWIHTSWHQKRILETINMHYYRFPCVNHVGFASPPSFNATVVNSLIVSWVSSETGAPTVEYGHLWAPAGYTNCHILLVPTGAHVLQGETGEG